MISSWATSSSSVEGRYLIDKERISVAWMKAHFGAAFEHMARPTHFSTQGNSLDVPFVATEAWWGTASAMAGTLNLTRMRTLFRISEFCGKNPGLGHFGRNRPKVATSGTRACGSPSSCADTSFGHPREYRTLQPPSGLLVILISRTDVTLASLPPPSF